jgi:hypothetical protein
MIRGVVKMDSISLGEGTFSFLSSDTKLTGKAAFANTKTGRTHGWTQMTTGWSKETLQKLQELRDLMEHDFATLHFSDTVETAQGLSIPISPDAAEPVGLGEHLGKSEAEQA